MYPTLLNLGFITFPSYFTLLTLGFTLAIWLAWRDSRRAGVDPDNLLDLSLYMIVAGLVGARILHVFADGYFWDYVHLCTDPLKVDVPSFIHVHCAADADCIAANAGALCDVAGGTCHPARDCFAALKFWQGGLAFYGGFVLAVGVGVAFIRRRKMGFLRTADLCAWGIALGLVFGRTGCLLAGCCFGLPTDAPVAVHFPGKVYAAKPDGRCPANYDRIENPEGQQICVYGAPAIVRQAKMGLVGPGARESLGVHPTQLYEAGFCALIFAWLYFWRRKRLRFPGQGFWELCFWYGLGRFLVEFLRDDDRGLWLGAQLSTSQIIALPFVVLGAWFLWRGWRNPPVAAPPTTPAEA